MNDIFESKKTYKNSKMRDIFPASLVCHDTMFGDEEPWESVYEISEISDITAKPRNPSTAPVPISSAT